MVVYPYQKPGEQAPPPFIGGLQRGRLPADTTSSVVKGQKGGHREDPLEGYGGEGGERAAHGGACALALADRMALSARCGCGMRRRIALAFSRWSTMLRERSMKMAQVSSDSPEMELLSLASS